jgi:DNA-binding transcriptional regulator LsrR (DeoR family)
MARPRSAPDVHLLSKVSSLYYLRDQTQQQIADRLRISRPTVSRLLQEAKEYGIVRISIIAPPGLHTELETQLETQYGLSEAVVVGTETRPSRDILLRQIGAAAAEYLTRNIQAGETIGVAWGTTLNEMVQAMTPLATEGVRVVQLLGGIGRPDDPAYAAGVVRRLAQLLDAAPVVLPVPGVVLSPAVRDALRADPHIRNALEHLDALDTVYLGIGALATNPVLTDGESLPVAAYRELVAAGAIGDLALRFFDAQGRFVRSSLDDRILGISAQQLRTAKRVVGVGGGPDKVEAVAAALRADVLDVLVTDHTTAEALLTGTRAVASAPRRRRA